MPARRWLVADWERVARELGMATPQGDWGASAPATLAFIFEIKAEADRQGRFVAEVDEQINLEF